MKKRILIPALLLLVLLCGCAGTANTQTAVSGIVCTTQQLATLTERVLDGTAAGDGTEIACVVTEPVSCLHDYTLSVRQMQLLENAAVHAEGMTQLTLRVFTLGSRAVFEVSDNGCGIPKERLRTLFTGVLPADAAADSGKHGMGIGLSVCAAIVKAHGGEIQAESKVGEGTSIRFWLETESIETEENEDEQ